MSRPAKVPGNLWIESFKGETVGTNLQGPFNSARSAKFSFGYWGLAVRSNAGGFLSPAKGKEMNNETQYKSSATIFGYCLAAAALIMLATIIAK